MIDLLTSAFENYVNELSKWIVYFILLLSFLIEVTLLVFALSWGPVLHFLFHGSLDHEPLHPQTPKDNPSGQKPPFWGHLW